jgi:hypothetical protein
LSLFKHLTAITAYLLYVVPDLACRIVMPAVTYYMLMGTFDLLQKLLELVEIDPFPRASSAMALWAGKIAHILFPLGIHGLSGWEIGLAITIRTLAKNLDFDFHGPPLVVK